MILIFKPQPELILVLLLQRLASELVNLLLEFQNMEVCYILVTTFSIFFASSISLIFSNLFEFCEHIEILRTLYAREHSCMIKCLKEVLYHAWNFTSLIPLIHSNLFELLGWLSAVIWWLQATYLVLQHDDQWECTKCHFKQILCLASIDQSIVTCAADGRYFIMVSP